MKEYDGYDLENEAISFAEWIFENNITKSDDLPDAYLYIGKLLTIHELYSVFENGKI